MDTVFEKIDGKHQNISMLISDSDKRYLDQLYNTYNADYRFVNNLLSIHKEHVDTYTKPLDPLYLQVNYTALFEIKAYVHTLADQLTQITRRFIADVESYFMERYQVNFSPFWERKIITCQTYFDGYMEIVAGILRQTGTNLLSAGAVNARLSLRKTIDRLAAKPTVSKNTIILPGFVVYRRSRNHMLSTDSTEAVCLLLNVISAMTGNTEMFTPGDFYPAQWQVRKVSFGEHYPILPGYNLSFYPDGRTELLCPQDVKAADLLAKIRGRRRNRQRDSLTKNK